MHFRSSKWVTENTATSVSSDRSQFLECVCDARLARSKSLVSASSWSERSSGTISQWPCVRNTVFMSSFKPPARKTFCWGFRLWVKRLKSAQHKKFVSRVWEVLPPLFQNWRGITGDCNFQWTCLSSLVSLPFLDDCFRYWSKTKLTREQLLWLNMQVMCVQYCSAICPNDAELADLIT